MDEHTKGSEEVTVCACVSEWVGIRGVREFACDCVRDPYVTVVTTSWSAHVQAAGAGGYLIVLESFDQLLAGLEQRDARAHVLLVLELHLGPGLVELLQHLLHAQLLGGLVDNVAHFVFKVVQIQCQQVGQVRVLVHDELDLMRKSSKRTQVPVESHWQVAFVFVDKILSEWYVVFPVESVLGSTSNDQRLEMATMKSIVIVNEWHFWA